MKLKPEKPYVVDVVRVRGTFDPASVTVDPIGRCETQHASLPAAQRAAAESADGDIFNAPKHLVRVRGPGVHEFWCRRCRETTRAGMLTARAVAATYTGRVEEAS